MRRLYLQSRIDLIRRSISKSAAIFVLVSFGIAGCKPANENGVSAFSQEDAKKQVSVADMTNEQFKFRVRRLTEKNEMVQAIEMLDERIAQFPEDISLKQALVSAKIQHSETIARLGDLSAAAQIMKEIGLLGREIFSGSEDGANKVDYVSALVCEARAYAYESNVEACVDALREAVDHGFGNLQMLERDPFFGKLRSSDEYAAMLDKMLHANATKAIREFTPVDFQFTLEDLSGQTVSLSDSHGKIRVIDLWGTWCAPCMAELPSFIRLQNEYAEDVEVIGINIERAESTVEARRLVQAVVDEAGINYACVLGDENTTQTVPGFTAFPTILFIDRVGKVRLRLDGTQSYERLQSVVEFLIAETE